MATPAGIAFDAFGTLFDLEALRPRLGDETFEAFAARLVPYTWHLTAAGRFEPFPEVAKAALSDADADPEVADTLEELPPFEDVTAGLSDLAAAGVPLAVLSNGTTEGIEALVSHAGLADRFTHLLAADRVERYKPAPELYALGPSAFDAAPADVLLVSGNEWDVAGAHWAGLRTAWVARGRSFSAFAGVEPDLAVQDLVELARTLQR